MTCWGSPGKRGILVGPERMNSICTDAEEERRGERSGVRTGVEEAGWETRSRCSEQTSTDSS